MVTAPDPYLPGSIPFSQYLEQLEYMFEHNEYPVARYKTSFLAVCGIEVFTELKKLFPGQDLKALTYKQMTDKLKSRYDKADSEVIHSFKFWTRWQGKYEKYEDFVIAIKVLAEKCAFGDFKDRAIRDMLVIGVYDSNLQKRLFDEEDLTASKAEKIILNQEMSSSRTQLLNEDDKRTSIVNRLGPKPEAPRGRHRSRSRSYERNSRSRSFSRGRSDNKYQNKNRDDTRKPSYFCSFCRMKGYTRKYCYRLNRKSPDTGRYSVKFVDSPKSNKSESDKTEIFKRLKDDISTSSDEEETSCLNTVTKNLRNEPCYV